MYGSMELKGALTGEALPCQPQGPACLAIPGAARRPYERLESERTAGLRAVAALPPDVPVAGKLERALDATRRRRSSLAIAERLEKPLSGGVRLESGRDFKLPVLTQSVFIQKSLDDLSALGVL